MLVRVTPSRAHRGVTKRRTVTTKITKIRDLLTAAALKLRVAAAERRAIRRAASICDEARGDG